jgi:hypothetical protein
MFLEWTNDFTMRGKALRLRFDQVCVSTHPNERRGIVLYRGETPGALGFDVHGGYGEHWTHDLVHAACYAKAPDGYVLKAILPEEAKRLRLVTVDEEGFWDYDPRSVRELANVAQIPFPAELILDHPPYDVWCPEWTQALIDAGYESIATVGLDGPEEYVLHPRRLILVDVVYTRGEKQ